MLTVSTYTQVENFSRHSPEGDRRRAHHEEKEMGSRRREANQLDHGICQKIPQAGTRRETSEFFALFHYKVMLYTFHLYYKDEEENEYVVYC